jgi:hypothetical protein
MRSIHTHFPTRRETALEWYRKRMRLPRGIKRRELVEHALRRGWLFYVPTQGDPEQIKGTSKIVSASITSPRSLFMSCEDVE